MMYYSLNGQILTFRPIENMIVSHHKKAGCLSVFDPSKKEGKPSIRLGYNTKKLGLLSPATYDKDDTK